jgi:hypothetical protein
MGLLNLYDSISHHYTFSKTLLRTAYGEGAHGYSIENYCIVCIVEPLSVSYRTQPHEGM